MKKLALLLAALVILSVAASVSVAAADQYPNGCADCHKGDKSLAATVKGLAKHPPVAATADVNTCLKCHKAGSKLALNKQMHDSHQKAKVACDACHVTKDGKVTSALKGVK
ncbi:MAG: hypothetical protein QME79_04525 [Bacillota bacterium]|nr:hypothetical protein [Bacillota bacterium]